MRAAPLRDEAARLRIRTELDRLLELAREQGRQDDPRFRQRLAWCYSQVEIMRYLGYRTLTRFLRGSQPGPESSIFKIFWSEYHQAATELAADVMGPHALVPSGRPRTTAFQTDDPGAPNSTASWVGTFLGARAETIYAGSSQIQRCRSVKRTPSGSTSGCLAASCSAMSSGSSHVSAIVLTAPRGGAARAPRSASGP